LNEKDNEQDQVKHFVLDVRLWVGSWRLMRPAAFSVRMTSTGCTINLSALVGRWMRVS
jgi:hypothetical protein